jgi:hypothetical protein
MPSTSKARLYFPDLVGGNVDVIVVAGTVMGAFAKRQTALPKTVPETA